MTAAATAAAAAALLLAAAPARGAQVIVAGDSWTCFSNGECSQGCHNGCDGASGIGAVGADCTTKCGAGSQPIFVSTFRKNNDPRTIVNVGAGGSTCAGWASATSDWETVLLPRLVEAVKAPDAERVWLVCGGNDAQGEAAGMPPMGNPSLPLNGLNGAAELDAFTVKLKTNIRTILAAVKTANPKVRVASFGYDFFAWANCPLGTFIFPHCSNDVSCINTAYMRLQTALDELAQERDQNGELVNDNFDSVSILGAMQTAGGVPGASIGNPVTSVYSPDTMFASDCIHPSALGYETVFNAFYDRYWAASKPAAGVTFASTEAPSPGAGPPAAMIAAGLVLFFCMVTVIAMYMPVYTKLCMNRVSQTPVVKSVEAGDIGASTRHMKGSAPHGETSPPQSPPSWRTPGGP